jgi:hypothetical protein
MSLPSVTYPTTPITELKVTLQLAVYRQSVRLGSKLLETLTWNRTRSVMSILCAKQDGGWILVAWYKLTCLMLGLIGASHSSLTGFPDMLFL